MRAVVQRVSFGKVIVDGVVQGEISEGIVLLIAIHIDDTNKDRDYIIDKVINMRIFCDNEGKMNLSLSDLGYEILVISQFTLYGDIRKGRRPSFTESAPLEKARNMYDDFIISLKKNYNHEKIQAGVFQADMKVELLNDGPVTILLDSRKEF